MDTNFAWNIIGLGIAIIIFLVGLMYIVSIFLRTTENRLKHFGIGCIGLLGGGVLFVYPQLIKGTFNSIAGILGVLIGLLVLLNSVKLHNDRAPWIWNLITAVIYISLGTAMLTIANEGRIFSAIFGIYLILFSFNIFNDAIVGLMGSNEEAQKVKKHIRISIPVVIAAFLPIRLLKKVNKLVEEDPEGAVLFENQINNGEIDLEIFIHTREGLIAGMGHVDIAMDGLVYSYGNYDQATWKFGGFFAEGVMVEMNAEEHIREALEVEKKILMVYGLSLSSEHKKAVREKLNEMISQLIPWEPLAMQCKKGLIEGEPEDYKDVSSELYNNTGAKFYKFRFGNPFKTYYVMGTNCVKLADTIVGKSGVNIMKINGIITPGAYLSYLDRLYERGDSIVVSRVLYQDIQNKGIKI
jgi:uncharacterized membrane protein